MSWSWQARAKATRLRSYANIYTSDQAVLDVLAYHANDDGHCRMGRGRISEACTLTERTVKRAISRLEERGYIEKRPGSGRGITNAYRLVPADERVVHAASNGVRIEGGIVSVHEARAAGFFNPHWKAAWAWLSRSMATALPIYNRVYYPDQCILSTLALLADAAGACETTRSVVALGASCDHQQAHQALQRLSSLGYIGLTWRRTADGVENEHFRAVIDPAALASLDRARERGYYARTGHDWTDADPGEASTVPLSDGQLSPFSEDLSTPPEGEATKGGQLNPQHAETGRMRDEADTDASTKGGQLNSASDRKGDSIQKSGHENGASGQLSPFQLSPQQLKSSKKEQVSTYVVNTSNRASAHARAAYKEGSSPDLPLGTETVSTAPFVGIDAPRTASPSAPMDSFEDEAGLTIQAPTNASVIRGDESRDGRTARTKSHGVEREGRMDKGARRAARQALDQRGVHHDTAADIVHRCGAEQTRRNVELYDAERRRRPGQVDVRWLIAAVNRDFATDRAQTPLLTYADALRRCQQERGPGFGNLRELYDPEPQGDGTTLWRRRAGTRRGAG